MAAQPDINAILAALAAQNRPASTPSQQPQIPQGLPPGFPGSIPQQVPTPLGGFQLPQPISSGSVDLSSVRPVNTGSVSIAEAIAKARSIAADKNIPSAAARDDPRLAGRSYRRSRSRSRSPSRRDAYNPYRDDRRGGSGSFGRDRSASPSRRQQGGYGARDRDEKVSETITVKSALVGLIIGRAGENLRRVESETGARVQFVPAREPGAQQRQCTISGSRRQVDAAKTEIYQTIEDNGGGGAPAGLMPPAGGRASAQPVSRGGGGSNPPLPGVGETTRQILVPDKTVGLIIGRGGETIRDLQDRSGCHVNIVGENKSINGRRPVNLIGTKEAADKAEAIIWEIVDSDTRAQGQAAAPEQGRRQADPYGQPQQFGGGGEDKNTESIHIPSEAVGMVIGKGGESIKEMQNKTGCKINVNQPGNPDFERKIDLVGTWNAIEAAKRLIWDKVDTVQQRDREGGRGGNTSNSAGNFGQQQQSTPAYGQAAAPAYGAPATAAPTSGDAQQDPYAQYGGYQNYMALWYAALAQQQQGGQQPAPGQ